MSTFLNEGSKKCFVTRPIPAPQSWQRKKFLLIMVVSTGPHDDGGNNAHYQRKIDGV
jgi:hypothetical protein